jgi:hypothetical protein
MTSPRSVSPPTPGAGFSMTSMTVVSTGICATCLLPAVSSGRFFSAAGFFALMPARRALDFAFFGVARFAANLRAGLALTLPRFELFLRAATRFFALAMAISCKACADKVISTQVRYAALTPSGSPHRGKISLAFPAPDLVKVAIEGRLPHGMGVVRLADLPAEWSRFGLPAH